MNCLIKACPYLADKDGLCPQHRDCDWYAELRDESLPFAEERARRYGRLVEPRVGKP